MALRTGWRSGSEEQQNRDCNFGFAHRRRLEETKTFSVNVPWCVPVKIDSYGCYRPPCGLCHQNQGTPGPLCGLTQSQRLSLEFLHFRTAVGKVYSGSAACLWRRGLPRRCSPLSFLSRLRLAYLSLRQCTWSQATSIGSFSHGLPFQYRNSKQWTCLT